MTATPISLNYPNYITVYANILVYRNRAAGDICSANVNGFIKGLSENKIKKCQ